ncbi:GNAT family N-acetyltransferase [Neisseria canis]|uniref:Acetyltransferase (GNAT) family n=1 Tax=Neisseria canis TaxID=493 RepID=A0A448DA61_9NEIS|nr:GNAT family N-acetyltransferase [Neisseria canis]OSI12467.1 hypothetical protein BWD07_05020 [Neisseria canis]VEF02788.1 Acetyltransferase (GNAT) family [Neisseria canis]
MHTVTYHPEQQKFTARHNGSESGFLTYQIRGDNTWNIDHTVVHPEFRGQGLAKVLVDAAIAEAETKQIKLTATCSYADKILQRKK